VHGWDRVRTSFWFVPSLMSALAAGAAAAALALDHGPAGRWVEGLWLAYGGSPEGAADVLKTIAGSMMTVAGVVFSITLVALSLASSQFGPRVLRNYMRDPINQAVLGAFVATFLYSVLVLLAVRRVDEGGFVPQIAVMLAVAMALASMALLVYFIHHVSVSIQADELVARLGEELGARVEVLFPEHLGEAARPRAETVLPEGFERDSRALEAGADGYLQVVDSDVLLGIAESRDLVVRIDRRPGEYLSRGMTLGRAWPASRATDEVDRELGGAFTFGNQRTPSQDIGFGIQQLVEVAMRALSPGVNEPFTAFACIDRLGSAMRSLAQRETPAAARADREGKLRVVARPLTFPEGLAAAFDPIRLESCTNVPVAMRLLDALESIAAVATRSADRAAVRRQVLLLSEGARNREAPRREGVVARCEALLAAWDAPADEWGQTPID
jgi:uncharacterized membrane protein